MLQRVIIRFCIAHPSGGATKEIRGQESWVAFPLVPRLPGKSRRSLRIGTGIASSRRKRLGPARLGAAFRRSPARYSRHEDPAKLGPQSYVRSHFRDHEKKTRPRASGERRNHRPGSTNRGAPRKAGRASKSFTARGRIDNQVPGRCGCRGIRRRLILSPSQRDDVASLNPHFEDGGSARFRRRDRAC